MIQNQDPTGLNNVIESLFSGEKDKISSDELELIIQQKNILSEKLLPIVSQKLELAVSDPYANFGNTNNFYWSVILLGLLEEKRAFEWIIKLCFLREEDIADLLGEDFITEELACVLALTGRDAWQQLKPIIENGNIYLFVRSACLEAMTIMYVQGYISRSDLVEYFQTLLRSCIEDEACDIEWSAELVNTYADIWPSECLEDIKELYGLLLVYTRRVCISDVFEALEKGEKASIDDIKKSVERFKGVYISDKHEAGQPTDDEVTVAIDKIFKDLMMYNRKLECAIDAFLSGNKQEGKIGRNEPCFCSSGKKYKKCCLDKKDHDSNVVIETCTITSEPVVSEEISSLSPAEHEQMCDLHQALYDDPYAVSVDYIHELIALHPNLPTLYNYLFLVLVKTGQYRKGMEVLKQTVKKFPKYLFGLTEYGNYCLRRGEPERIPEIFNNCWTLSQLYPDRDTFHTSEMKSFSFLMASYYIEIGKFKQAKIYLSFLRQFADSEAVETIKEKIRIKAFSMKEEELPAEIVTLMGQKHESFKEQENALA